MFRKKIQALIDIQTRWKYLLITVVFTLGFILLAIWLPNLEFIKNTILSTHTTLHYKSQLLMASLGAFNTNFTNLSRGLTVAVGLSVGVSISLTVYVIRDRYKELASGGSLSFLGLVAGVFGVGCATCGSVLLTQLFGLSSLALIKYMPLRGGEFSILSFIILLFSINKTLGNIVSPTVCKVDFK